VAVLVTGEHLGEMTGLELLACAHRLHPQAERVLMVEYDYRAASPWLAQSPEERSTPQSQPPDGSLSIKTRRSPLLHAGIEEDHMAETYGTVRRSYGLHRSRRPAATSSVVAVTASTATMRG
jgi:hypothetical protein